MKNKLDIEFLKSLFHCDPESGTLIWKANRGCYPCGGKVAGGPDNKGYQMVRIGNVQYGNHRIIWAICTGVWPENDIDHINGNRSDNRFVNLRAATRGENLQNQRKAHRDNKSGYLGVTRNGKKWVANITVQGQTFQLGTYPSPSKAHEAYLWAKRILHPTCTL